MDFKYAVEIAAVPSCPPREAKPCDGAFLRLLFEDPAHPNNFRPPAAINPTRAFEDDEQRCDAWGLSLFVSEERIDRFIGNCRRKYKRLPTKIGTHVGRVTVREEDGLATPCDSGGHFSLHESASADWSGRFTIVRAA